MRVVGEFKDAGLLKAIYRRIAGSGVYLIFEGASLEDVRSRMDTLSVCGGGPDDPRIQRKSSRSQVFEPLGGFPLQPARDQNEPRHVASERRRNALGCGSVAIANITGWRQQEVRGASPCKHGASDDQFDDDGARGRGRDPG